MKNLHNIYIEKSTIVECQTKGSIHIRDYVKQNGNEVSDFVRSNVPGKKLILVIGGGMSAEREVSLESSEHIINSLLELNYHVTFINMGADIASAVELVQPDIVFNALHGTYGEDGCLPGLLNIMNIPYTGVGVLASSIAFNKNRFIDIMRSNSIVVAESIVLKKGDNIDSDPIKRPFVIKPIAQGSSVGVEIIDNNTDFSFKDYDFPYGDILVEKYISGRELQVAVLNGKALGVLEIKLLQGKSFYDYEAKYTDGFTEHVYPALISEFNYQKVLNIAEKTCKIMDCDTGLVRAEMIYDEKNDEIYMLEINTHPGFTSLSICPEIAAGVGISFSELIEQILAKAKFEK